jgi:hypothetical protein
MLWYNLLQPAGWGFWSQQGTIPNPATSDVDRLLADGPAIIGRFAAGGAAGLREFIAKLPENLLDGLLEWLKLPSGLKDLFGGGAGLKEFAGALLQVVGYDWDSLPGLLAEAVGPDNLAAILEIVEQVSAFVEAPDKLFGWVQDKIKEVGELTVDRWPPTAVAA